MRIEIIEGIKEAIEAGFKVEFTRQECGTVILCVTDDCTLIENLGSLETL